jgi:AcrR family transcriptional regulator
MQRKAVTRQELLLAGRQLFSTKGLYESRVEDLTRTARIAKGTLYLYFRDKDDLVRAVVTAGFELLQRRVRAETEGKRSLDGVLRAIVAAHLAFFQENPDLMRIFHQARGMLKFDRPRWRPLRQPLLQHLALVAELLGQALPLARMTAAQRFDLAIQLFGMVSGVTSVRVAVKGRMAWREPRSFSGALLAASRYAALATASTQRRRPWPVARAPRRRQSLRS